MNNNSQRLKRAMEKTISFQALRAHRTSSATLATLKRNRRRRHFSSLPPLSRLVAWKKLRQQQLKLKLRRRNRENSSDQSRSGSIWNYSSCITGKTFNRNIAFRHYPVVVAGIYKVQCVGSWCSTLEWVCFLGILLSEYASSAATWRKSKSY